MQSDSEHGFYSDIMPFHIVDLRIWILVFLESWNQSLEDSEGWLFKFVILFWTLWWILRRIQILENQSLSFCYRSGILSWTLLTWSLLIFLLGVQIKYCYDCVILTELWMRFLVIWKSIWAPSMGKVWMRSTNNYSLVYRRFMFEAH